MVSPWIAGRKGVERHVEGVGIVSRLSVDQNKGESGNAAQMPIPLCSRLFHSLPHVTLNGTILHGITNW